MNQSVKQALKEIPEANRKHFLLTLQEFLAGNTKVLSKYRHYPVDVRTFIEDPYYLDAMVTDPLTGKRTPIVYPAVMPHLIEINEGEYDEVVCTGGIGAAKSTVALYTQCYQLYLLSCMTNPQAYFGLDPSSEIVIIIQAGTGKLAEEGDYERLRAMIERSPYFREKFPFEVDLESQLKFPNRIYVQPVSGTETAAIGKNVIGGILEEVNFMATIQTSKRAEGEAYDQATVLYNSIARRRQSRFMELGRLPGRLCLVSSRKTPGQFTDKKEAEAKTNPRIYVYDKRVWEVRPPGSYCGQMFNVFIGDGQRQPRLLGENETVPDEDRHLVDAIPIEYLQAFHDDISKALRDIAGRSTSAIHPYLPRVNDVVACFGRRHNVFVQESIDFAVDQIQIRKSLARHRAEYPRWAHIDLGLTSDSAGLVIGHVPEFKSIKRGDSIEMLPLVEIDGILEIRPPKGLQGEIDFASIRRIVYKLRDMGLPIKWISMDSYQSADSMQVFRGQGFIVGHQSIDTTMVPYDLTKQALYDRRVLAPKHDKLLRELGSLERDFKKGKVDHPAKGSKDLSDCLAGVTYGLTTRRETWAIHRVPIMQAHSVASIVRDQESKT